MAAGGLVRAVTEQARARAADWFPELDARSVEVRPLGVDSRARCFLHWFALEDGVHRRTLVVKVRHSEPGLRRLDRFVDRPVLAPERTMSDEETGRLEYDGLRTLADVFEPLGDERFGVLRAHSWLPEHCATVMELVEEPTLRRRVLMTARLRRRRVAPVPDDTWRNVGAWLRTFQDALPHEDLPARIQSNAEVAELYRAYADFLTSRIGRNEVLGRLRDQAGSIVSDTLPDRLPMAVGHGDFVTNNMFAGATGRITVFDPLIRWQVPRYQDLATLTVGLRVVPVQSASLGLVLPTTDLDRYERTLLEGYHDGDPTQLGAVRAFQLLVLLDRWSATVSKQVQRSPLRRGLHDVRVAVGSRHYRREVRRVLALLGR